jgi:hypothetical protein
VPAVRTLLFLLFVVELIVLQAVLM